MKNLLLIVACISIATGLFCGTLLVWLLYIRRQNKGVDSLVRLNHVVGLSGTVEIPFNRESQGKVRLNVKGSIVDFVAFTDELKAFTKGEKVFVVGMRRNKVWVIAEDSLHYSLGEEGNRTEKLFS